MAADSTVQVSLNIPQAEKDAIDAAMIVINDLKAGKAGSILSDLLPQAIKVFGELSALGADLKSKGSVDAVLYLEQQLAGVFLFPAAAAPAAPAAS